MLTLFDDLDSGFDAPLSFWGDEFRLPDDLILPEGAGSKILDGRLALPLNAAAAGEYQVWVHCYWQNSCGNSVACGVGGDPKSYTCKRIKLISHSKEAQQLHIPSFHDLLRINWMVSLNYEMILVNRLLLI